MIDLGGDSQGREDVSSVGYSPKVYIVVLNWNGGDDTLQCLESLQTLSYKNFSIVLVDNGSTDGSVERIRKKNWPIQITFIETGKNLGFAEGNNVGIRYALAEEAEFILLLNNDTVVDGGMVDELISAAARYPQDGCFGPRILYMDRPDTVWFNEARWDMRNLRLSFPGQDKPATELPSWDVDTDYVCGAALFFRAEVARQIGLLDSRFFLVFEEADWCFRAHRAGYGCKVVPSAKLWHKVGASFGSEGSPLRTYFSSRNRLLWGERNLPWRSRLRLLFRSFNRLFPHFALSADHRVPIPKRVLWASRQYLRAWYRRIHDPHQRALRMGIRDYLLRQFGDCPIQVREISDKWAESRQRALVP